MGTRRGIVRRAALGAVGLALGLMPSRAAAPPSASGDYDSWRPALRDRIERYETDRGSLERSLPAGPFAKRAERLRAFDRAWLDSLNALDFDTLDRPSQIDALLLKNHTRHALATLDVEEANRRATAPLLPFAPEIAALAEARRDLVPLDPRQAADRLFSLGRAVGEARKAAEDRVKAGDKGPPAVALRARREAEALRAALAEWFAFYDGYDPGFTWWAAEPYRATEAALRDYAAYLGSGLAGVNPADRDAIVGEPVGAAALRAELDHALIAYSPEQLVALAEREFAWCETELKKAAAEMGCGDDWKAALNRVKSRHVEPGRQPALIRELAEEATRYVIDNDLVTVPPLAREVWRLEMMSPERQRVNPFFTGGEVISVAFPTAGMSHEQKLMSLRGNNAHFARATVHHELIPGHHLQAFMAERHRPYRRAFRTPFLVEGWPLYWETLLWDRGFARSPEDRVGMLFWRSHRCARIIFSLDYHLGRKTPAECVRFLTDRVGHEPENATAEVRRSVSGGYEPLYQAAYMLGGLQLRALRAELVGPGPGQLTDRAFHDAVLRENAIPIELIRASLLGQDPGPDFTPSWKFAGPLELPPARE